MRKKGGLAENKLVIMVLALLILVVLLFIYTSVFRSTGGGIKSTMSCAGKCIPKEGVDQCTGPAKQMGTSNIYCCVGFYDGTLADCPTETQTAQPSE